MVLIFFKYRLFFNVGSHFFKKDRLRMKEKATPCCCKDPGHVAGSAELSVPLRGGKRSPQG